MQVTAKLLASLSNKELPHLMAPLASAMNEFFPIFGITTEVRIEQFLAQCLHEADGFHTLEEYASGNAYDTRTDLGNTPERDGDGAKFKGRGILQTTGKANYTRAQKRFAEFGVTVDLIKNPQLLSQPRYAVLAACIYWDDKKLNALADLNSADGFKRITRKINGGYNGLDDRIRYLGLCRKAIDEGKTPAGLVGPGSTTNAISNLQRLLKERGYPIGAVDGRWGKMTRDAVMSFKADNFLDVSDQSVNLGDVMVSGPRVIPSREAATVTDLRERGSTTVAGADNVQRAGLLATAGAGGASFLSQAEVASDYWRRVKELLGPLYEDFGWVFSNPFFYVAIVSGVAFYYAQRVKAKRLEEFKQGKVQ